MPTPYVYLELCEHWLCSHGYKHNGYVNIVFERPNQKLELFVGFIGVPYLHMIG